MTRATCPHCQNPHCPAIGDNEHLCPACGKTFRPGYITLDAASAQYAITTRRIKELLTAGRLQGAGNQCGKQWRWQLVDVNTLDEYEKQKRANVCQRSPESIANRDSVLCYCEAHLASYGRHAPMADIALHCHLTRNQVRHYLNELRRDGLLPRNHQPHRNAKPQKGCRLCGLADGPLVNGLCQFCREEQATGRRKWYELNLTPSSSWRAGSLGVYR